VWGERGGGGWGGIVRERKLKGRMGRRVGGRGEAGGGEGREVLI